MANVIRHKRGTSDPVAGDFSDTAELLVNTTDGGLFTKTDGGSVVEIGAGGGGGLTEFVESQETASPNATVPVDALTATDASYTDIDVALIAKGTGATLAQVPDGTNAGGNKRGTYATDWQKARTAATQVASGSYAFIGGGIQNTASFVYAAVAGGSNNNASGQAAFIGAGINGQVSGVRAALVGGFGNTASSNYSFVGGGESNEAKTNTHATCAGGYLNDATGQYSFVGGGQSNVASGLFSVVCGGGGGNTANASYAIIVGGYGSRATGQYSFIAGGAQGTTRGITGNHVFPACKEPIAAAQGVTQSGLLLLGRQTTDATATVLASNSSAAGTTNQVILPNNSAYAFKGTVIATVTGGGDTAAWEFKGAIKRGANAASTAIVGTVIKDVLAYDAGASSWDVAFTADTTNGGLKVEVTGAAATTIRWVAKLETTEVTY